MPARWPYSVVRSFGGEESFGVDQIFAVPSAAKEDQLHAFDLIEEM